MKKVLLITLSFAVLLLTACSTGSKEEVDKQAKYYSDYTDALNDALEDDAFSDKEIEKLMSIENDYYEWMFANTEKNLKYADKKGLDQIREDYSDAKDEIWDMDADDTEDYFDASDDLDDEWDEKFEDLYDEFD